MSKYRFYGDWLPCRVFARCAGENSLIDIMLQAAITHTDNETITSLEYTWKAPVTNEGDIVFKWVSNRIMSFWKICLNDVTYLNQRPRLPPPPYTFCSCIGYGTRWKKIHIPWNYFSFYLMRCSERLVSQMPKLPCQFMVKVFFTYIRTKCI